ncbi:hypothetical protein RZS08_20430 [Arthrospira platensis SPKY1]|nr:hypothetical protein [Arthrospira platensis SPKY1]
MGQLAAAKKDQAYDKWQAEEDLRTLTRAKEIEKDPKRMAHVRRAAKEKLSEMAQIKALAAGQS